VNFEERTYVGEVPEPFILFHLVVVFGSVSILLLVLLRRSVHGIAVFPVFHAGELFELLVVTSHECVRDDELSISRSMSISVLFVRSRVISYQ